MSERSELEVAALFSPRSGESLTGAARLLRTFLSRADQAVHQ